MGKSLDVDALQEVLGRPEITLLGEKLTGRYPSFNERWEIEARWDATDFADAESQREMVRFVAGKLGFPAEPLFELPEAILSEVLLYFLGIARGTYVGTTMFLTSNEPSAPSESEVAPSPSPR